MPTCKAPSSSNTRRPRERTGGLTTSLTAASRSITCHSANLRSSIRYPFHTVRDRVDSGGEAAAQACPLVEHILPIGAVAAELTESSSSRIRAGPIGVSAMWTPNASSACSIALMIAAAPCFLKSAASASRKSLLNDLRVASKEPPVHASPLPGGSPRRRISLALLQPTPGDSGANASAGGSSLAIGYVPTP